MSSFFDYVAIDPLALLLPGPVYIRIVEKLHPHVPKVAEVAEAATALTPQEKSFVLARARTVIAYGQAVEKALEQK
jgi:hypothetical protein